ncbi:hypothetical protein QVD17_32068 [Tagetes erecta]|uniref:RING-type E3 ubiquitin transferase n=1 Tax=Tagetes erecta TaxID=13708 RepID=A0AAD8K5L2_TARER|nr:hypothetical protein QVD17_32060 [Tagetes erecta]KAK1416279.1 hypothetical protein QVD17_32068 [Tagetes erecta]
MHADEIEYTSGSIPILTMTDQNDRILDDEPSDELLATEYSWYQSWLESRHVNNLNRSVQIGTSEQNVVQNCVICHEDYKADETIGTLECKHVYHEACIKTWLLVKNECPICRAVV